MAAPASKFKFRAPTVATSASTGITLSDATLAPVNSCVNYVLDDNGFEYRTVVTMRAFTFATTAAAKSIGQKLFDFPEGFIVPKWGMIELSSTTGGSTAATAGEIGLGTVVGSGANATLGAVGATSEDIMEGTTISNHVAATALSSNKANAGVVVGTQGATGPAILDGTSTAKSCFFNIASTFNGTGGVTVNSLRVTVDWVWLGDV